MSVTSLELAKVAAIAADDKKATDIVLLDLTSMSDVCDYFLICSGTNARLVDAIVDEIENRLRLLVGESAVEKRALGELAAPRKACARGKAGFKDAARHNGTAVALEFHNILARI